MTPEQDGQLFAALSRIEKTLGVHGAKLDAIEWRQNFVERSNEERMKSVARRLDKLESNVDTVEDTQRVTAIDAAKIGDSRRWDILKAAIIAGLAIVASLVTNVLLAR